MRISASCPITVSPNQTIEAMVQAGNFEYSNPLISDSFTLNPVNWFAEAEVVSLERKVGNHEVRDLLADNYRRTLGMAELLSVRLQYPELDLSDPLVALDAVYTNPNGQRYIGCMFEFAGEPNLGVIWERQQWSAGYRFLVAPI